MESYDALIQLLGLSKIQAKVYLAALELGEANMLELSRKSKVKRTTIYNFIDELKSRNIIIETKRRKTKVYSAISPRHLYELQNIRMMQVQNALPELMAIYNKSSNKPRVSFYEGIDGIKEIYADTLIEGENIIGWSDYDHMKLGLGDSYFKYYPEERTKRGMSYTAIARDCKTTRETIKIDKNVNRQTKLMGETELRTEINIYGDKVALMSFHDNPVGVLIDDKNISQTLRVIWKEMWGRLD